MNAKKRRFLLVLTGLVVIAFLFCFVDVQGKAGKLIDNFDQELPTSGHSRFAGTASSSQKGYGIYYAEAKVKLSHVSFDSRDKGLKVDFKLPPYFSWGNWLTIRREFGSPINLSKYNGLKMNLYVMKPCDAKFRMTLCDLNKSGNSDEMWWHDFEENILSKKGKWIKLKAPFDKFKISHGGGTRHNDNKLDLSRVVGYEINVISSSKDDVSGIFVVDKLSAY